MRNLLYVVCGTAALTLAVTSACSTETTDTSDGGSGGSTTSAGGTGGTSTSTGGTGGTGGGASCASCSEYLLDSTDSITIDMVCGFDATTDGCNAGSSCELVGAVAVCTCGEDDMGTNAMCLTECMLSCTDTGMDQPNCQDCVLNSCSGPANECLADMGNEGTP